ncbi:hypothetical protein HZB03_00645 [Candidatus Woesearchaeota archaeon]|nr:hypothetical protein [Candidatus Woesearchaeota archaeon]
MGLILDWIVGLVVFVLGVISFWYVRKNSRQISQGYFGNLHSGIIAGLVVFLLSKLDGYAVTNPQTVPMIFLVMGLAMFFIAFGALGQYHSKKRKKKGRLRHTT